jgi:hypothetical protein
VASSTKAFRVKKKRKSRNKGRERKAALEANGSTPTREDFFGDAKKD